MREIKFRGKKADAEEWLYGSLLIDIPQKKYYIVDNKDGSGIGVSEKTIGQYTRLHDKNGKEIYEGDILEYDTGARFVVVFDEMMIMCPKDRIELTSPGYFGILIGDKTKELCPLGNTRKLCKVIGNTIDNPELLKEE